MIVFACFRNYVFTKMDDDCREFVNEFPEYQNENDVPYNLATKESSPVWKEKLEAKIEHNLCELERGLPKHVDWKDHTVYTGTSGISLLYLYLANSCVGSKQEEFLKKSLAYVEPALKSLKGHRVSFLCGDPGPLAIAAVVYHKLGKGSKSAAVLEKLQALHKVVIEQHHSDLPDELLYGRTGYLFSLLFVQKHITNECIDPTARRMVIESIIKSGIKLAKKENWKCPLMYQWHDKHYLGAAHGVSGILYMLMEVSESLTLDEKNNLVKPTIDYLISLKFSSGNFPSSIGNKTDRLVHWCHGAPGFIHMFAMAFKVFDDEKYLQEALSCGDVIWKRGLLRKGYGLCHGTAGNAFAFLVLYKITNNPKHLYRATKFAELCFDMETRRCRTPDRPLSLFEGLAGTIYFLVSMLNVESVTFPAFNV